MKIAGIDQATFSRRRQQLMAQLPSGSAVLLAGATMQSRNSDVEYMFRQDSSFYYLTGFDEPDAVLLLLKEEDETEFVLFCLDRDPELEIWNGYRTGPKGCMERYCADKAWPIDQLDEKMCQLLDGFGQLHYLMGQDESLDAQVHSWLNTIGARARQGAQAPETLVQLAPVLAEMRLFKQPEEQALMRKAGQISAEAHKKAMLLSKPDLYEFQLEAEITHHFAQHGCRQCAYPSIVGGGANGCILHYTENNQPLNAGELVLIDAGIELDYYAADITRTFPVDGRFSSEQKTIYELVLKAQLVCIEMCQPGTLWNDIHERSVEVLTAGLLELDLLEGELSELIEQEAYKAFYMHRIGHWLGMDVHDVGSYKIDGDWRPLQSGMVLTVEPGIYIAPDNESVEPRWRGIGVRIEDNILVTDTGYEVLTDAVPKSVADIEALMA